jgi:Sulfotransferase domain
VEKALLAGTHRTRSQQTSILHFSLNKAATQYTKAVLQAVARENHLTPVGMNEWAFGSTQPYLDHLTYAEMESYKHVFRPKGYLYSVFGGMIENIDQPESYKILLMVRDPRDILVSGYFSTAFSHPLPGEKSDKRAAFEQKRDWAQSVSIDEYVLAEAPRLLKNLQRYHDLLLSRHPHTLLLRYEEMIGDFESWLNRILQYTPRLRQKLLENHRKQRPVTENIDRHLRKGVAGDYREKLQPETIAALNRLFEEVLPVFGY